jgi:glycosyltransferase involved in cell wall biosynthesis
MKNSLGIYIPLYNEEEGIDHLESELAKLELLLKDKCNYEIILIDDGSIDNTLELLKEKFNKKLYRVISHSENKNLGGFLKTSIKDCQKDFIAFLDSDCTYNPSLLNEMYDLSLDGFSVVNASPYHPKGIVVGVGKIRLFLSKSVNRVYRFISGKDFYTTSSICKIYKTELIKKIPITRKNFIAVTELFTKCMLITNKGIDFPCTLSTRLFGVSKLDIYSNIIDHMKYIVHFVAYKYAR